MTPKHEQPLIASAADDRDLCDFSRELVMGTNMGDQVEICRPLQEVHYASEVIHVNEDRWCVILYDVEKQEILSMGDENWRFKKLSLIAFPH